MTDIDFKINEISKTIDRISSTDLNHQPKFFQNNGDIKDINISSNKNFLTINIEKLKEIQKLFSDKVNILLNEIEKIPDKEEYEEVISPASNVVLNYWTWLYTNKSETEFIFEDPYYIANNSNGKTLMAYSSISTSNDLKFKIEFKDVKYFTCGGFGCLSMDDPEFYEGKKINKNYPLFCICCNESWGNIEMNINDQFQVPLQTLLKEKSEKTIIFEINIDEDIFRIYYPDESSLYSYAYLSSIPYKSNMVLVYFTNSIVNHSHEIIPIN